MHKRKYLIVVLLAIVSLNLFPSSSLAQGSNDSTALTVSPVMFTLAADPGDIITNQIKIFNPTRDSATVKVAMEDFTPIGEEGEVALTEPDDNSTFSVANWTTFTPSEFTLNPNQQQIVSFTTRVPVNAEPGGHYGSVVASISTSSPQVNGSSLTTKTGSLVLVNVSGNAIENLTIEEFSTQERVDRGPVDFTVRFKNSGTVHVVPAGFISIVDIWGKEVALIEIPQNLSIPNSIRQANAQWSDVPLVGRYTATLVANYGNASKQTLTATYTFMVFPLVEGSIVIAVVLVLLFLLFIGRKRIGRAVSILVKGETTHR